MKRFNLSRTIAISVLVSTGVFLEIQASSSGEDGENGRSGIVRMLDEKRVTVRDISGSAMEAINVLRFKYGVPVAFISVPGKKPDVVEFRDEELTLRETLDRLVQSRDGYTYSLVGGRLVVYPTSGPFEKTVGGVDIRNASRWEAARALVEHLKRTDTDFASLTGPPIKGDFRAPVYADRVSLPGEATVLEHLAALLGDNLNVTFSILDWRGSEKRYFVLEQVQSSEAKRAADARNHSAPPPCPD